MKSPHPTPQDQGGEMAACQECGMVCRPAEYHPFAACLMFKACHDGGVVRANLEAVRAAAAMAPDSAGSAGREG